MSFTCQHCGKISTQPLNYCRQCGAPALTINLAPISTEADPFDTWEPTKPVVAPIATEMLPAVTATAPPASMEFLAAAPTAAALPQPVNATPLAMVLPIQLAASALRPALRRNGFVAAIAAGVLILLSGGGYVFRRSMDAPPVAPAILSATPPAEMQSVAIVPTPTTEKTAVALVGSATPAPAIANAKATLSVKAETPSKASAQTTSVTNETASVKSVVPDAVSEQPAVVDNHHSASKLSLIEQGNQLANAGQLQEALQLYEKARRANPENLDVYYLLGSVYLRAGDFPKALAAYRQCTAGNYAAVAANHVKNLEKKLSKVNKGQPAVPEL